MLKRIGYWRSLERPELPDPSAFIDLQWDAHQRDVVTWYFTSGTIAKRYKGDSTCRVCGAANGSLEYTDGTLLWPEGFAHYIREHGIRPPTAIIDVVMQRINDLLPMDTDAGWWMNVTSHD